MLTETETTLRIADLPHGWCLEWDTRLSEYTAHVPGNFHAVENGEAEDTARCILTIQWDRNRVNKIMAQVADKTLREHGDTFDVADTAPSGEWDRLAAMIERKCADDGES